MRLLRAAGAAALLLLTAASAVAQEGAWSSFVIQVGADTFAVESFTRTPTTVEGELSGLAFGRIVYRAELDARFSTRSLLMQAWPRGAALDSAALQEVRITVREDSATAEVSLPGVTQTQRLQTRHGAVVLVNPSFALTEQIVLRAREIGGEVAEVPVLMVQGGQTMFASVRPLGADSVTITLAGSVVRAAVGPDGRLLGGVIPGQQLVFTRVEGRIPYAPGATPDYSAPEGAPYTAEEVVVTTPAGHTLAGTLTRPHGSARVPAVVTITGSGAQDRDQWTPFLPDWRPFREIADTLSRRGIAVLRLDDRGTGASRGDFASATSADFADDIRAALAYLRGRADIDGSRLGLVGHSEGGMVGPMVAADDPALRALVVIAGPAQTGREIIHFQQRQAVERSDAFEPASRDSVLAAGRLELEEVAARQPWLAYFLEHDPLPVARRVRTPVLILHGETDRQVTVEQAEHLAGAFREGSNPDVTVQVFPGINHLLVADPDGDPSGYGALADRRVSRALLGTLADWLAARLR
jgi:uncharacterized protein